MSLVPLAGRRIVAVRRMTEEEMAREMWYGRFEASRPFVLELEGDLVLYPARDREGNGPGALFGYSGNLDCLFEVFGEEEE